MINLPPIKRGDTFSLGCVSTDSSGVPENLTDIAIRSQIRSGSSKALIEELSIAKSDQTTNPGEFSLTSTSTSNWPIGSVLCDIEFKNGAVVTSTETLEITVLLDITHND